MKLLLVAATKHELGSLMAHYHFPDESFLQHENFDVLITGVGMTATAFALGRYLNPNYDLVLNVGVAGSFNDKLSLGSIVNVYSDCFAELGAEDHDHFITIDEMGFGTSTYLASVTLPDLPKVKGITVNKVHGNKESILKTRERLEVDIESMEGAAVLYACQKSNIPSLQVRSISNYVTPRDRETWQIEIAIKNLNTWLVEFLDKYHSVKF